MEKAAQFGLRSDDFAETREKDEKNSSDQCDALFGSLRVIRMHDVALDIDNSYTPKLLLLVRSTRSISGWALHMLLTFALTTRHVFRVPNIENTTCAGRD